MCLVKGKKLNLLIKRIFDIFFSFSLLLLILPIVFLIVILIKMDSKGPVLFWSKRFGKNKILFNMPKFRSMINETPITDTKLKKLNHLCHKIWKIFKKTSIDEIPQLLSVLKGEMSLVGPRPALYTQNNLIQLREKHDVNFLKPGITGLAQINGRDNITLHQKVQYDREYYQKQNFCIDVKILFKTIYGLKWLKDISH